MLNLRAKAEEAASSLPGLMVQAQRAAASIVHGDHTQRKAGGGEKFWQFREYAPGDRPQDIDWRQSAKTDRVFIRQKEWQTTQTTMLWCARGPGMEFSSDKTLPTKADTAKILALGLAILLTRAGEQTGLFGATRTGRSDAMLETIGNALCEPVKVYESLPDFAAHTLAPHTTFIQIGDFLEPAEDIEAAFKSLNGRTTNGLVVQILDPAELDLGYAGRMLFEDPGNKTRELVNHVPSIRGAYQKRMQDHLGIVQDLCRQCQWSYVLHRTDHDVADTLAAIWAMMEEQRR